MNIKLKKLRKVVSIFIPLTRKFTDACMDAIGGMYKPKYRIYPNFFSRPVDNDINMNTVRKYAV